jgi:hypothetical protein
MARVHFSEFGIQYVPAVADVEGYIRYNRNTVDEIKRWLLQQSAYHTAEGLQGFFPEASGGSIWVALAEVAVRRSR